MIGIDPTLKKIVLVAITFVIATFIVSCGSDIPEADEVDLKTLPSQIVRDLDAIQSTNGDMQMRMSAPLMERYTEVEVPYEIFPEGFRVFAYTKEGLLETEIIADIAKHITEKNSESWEAYGNVKIMNYIKGEKMLTDTLYWNKAEKKIYTHCFVELYSPSGFMQGYGMESDELARNASIFNPFDSFGVLSKDSTSVSHIDTVNFIGPLL